MGREEERSNEAHHKGALSPEAAIVDQVPAADGPEERSGTVDRDRDPIA
jgi:hypothetical protein